MQNFNPGPSANPTTTVNFNDLNQDLQIKIQEATANMQPGTTRQIEHEGTIVTVKRPA